MSTKIILDEPFSLDYACGYLNTNREPRRVLMLVGLDGRKTSTSYARYLMSCRLKRYLNSDEHVDHIDNDKMNDSIDNLQILTQKENNAKNKKRTFIELLCPVCRNTFHKEARQVNFKIKNGKTPTCSRSCGGKMSRTAPLS